jgi:gliding motility-associated-like protein
MARIDTQQQGINYPVIYAVTGVPTNLDARNIGDFVLWEPSVNLNDPSIFSPIFTGNADQSFTVEIKTNTGCTTVDTQLVKISSRADMYVPTAFTPNQDGLNDILRPVLVGIKELRYFKIFNRWGQLLFETKTNGLGWDGRVKGVATYNQVVVWMVEGIGWDNKIYFRKGTSTVVR